ncbi:MAG: hydroxymethylglutaryl-CoA lyase [Rhodobacteraceae bacterium]|nr:hydroxymethylglutaryl-CoA lyase [Paracoccaceae bacterium]
MARVTLFEVGPRDGLQNEARLVPAADKIRLVDLLSATGLRRIEVTSFVSPHWVPQMADAAEVLGGIARAPGVSYAALTPNLQGFTAARAARADEVAVFASASEGFSRKNLNCSIAESLERFAPVLAAAQAAGVPVRGYVSCITECPYDGPVAPEVVLTVARDLLAMGCYEVSLGDTLGHATPAGVERLLALLVPELGAARLAGHFHDTQAWALDNIAVALDHGLRVFDSSVGGMGGCPYAPGAKGNVATEAVLTLMERLGHETGVDPAALEKAARHAAAITGRDR